MLVQARSKSAKFDAGRYQGLSREHLLRIYRTMYLSRRLDDREIQLKRQNKTFFQISGAGHEGVLAAAGLILRPGYDWVYPYYRDRALCLAMGITPLEMLLHAMGKKDDPNSGGRQMPSHWGSPRLNIFARSSATGMQYTQAAGIAQASLYSRCLKSLHLLILIEDNGYAISVPVEFETAGGSISRLVANYPALHIEECDGTDPLASYAVLKSAAEYCRARKGPALVHAHVTRPYSHSLSDDEKLYKSEAERSAEAQRDPLPK